MCNIEGGKTRRNIRGIVKIYLTILHYRKCTLFYRLTNLENTYVWIYIFIKCIDINFMNTLDVYSFISLY
jgi:ABC-type uncharacterized transport system permease subunit